MWPDTASPSVLVSFSLPQLYHIPITSASWTFPKHINFFPSYLPGLLGPQPHPQDRRLLLYQHLIPIPYVLSPISAPCPLCTHGLRGILSHFSTESMYNPPPTKKKKQSKGFISFILQVKNLEEHSMCMHHGSQFRQTY